MNQTAVSILGTGKLGTVLARALVRHGYSIGGLFSRNPTSARESRRLIGEGKVLSRPEAAAELGNIIFLTTSDDAILPLTEKLAETRISWKNRIVFHCSGIHPSAILDPLARKGGLTASLHPVQSVVHKRQDPAALENIYFGVEGCPPAVKKGREIVKLFQGKTIDLAGVSRPSYHAACSLVSNYFLPLLETAAGILERTGISREQGIKILTPLVQGTLQNVNIFGMAASHSGPLTRGDINSFLIQLRAMEELGGAEESLYRKLSLHTLEILEAGKTLPFKTIRTLKELLEEK